MVFIRDFTCMFIELYLQPTLKQRLLDFGMICSTLCLHRFEKSIPTKLIKCNKSKCKVPHLVWDSPQYQHRVGE